MYVSEAKWYGVQYHYYITKAIVFDKFTTYRGITTSATTFITTKKFQVKSCLFKTQGFTQVKMSLAYQDYLFNPAKLLRCNRDRIRIHTPITRNMQCAKVNA